MVAAKVAGGLRLTWTPAQAIPGTPAITGYRAHAVAQTATGGEQVEVGRRIAGQAARGTTITGLSGTESDHVEVVSVSSVGETFPAVTAQPVTDTTPPTGAYRLQVRVERSRPSPSRPRSSRPAQRPHRPDRRGGQ